MNPTDEFRQSVEHVFGHLMNPVMDIDCEVIGEHTIKPRLVMVPQMIHVTDDDYAEMEALILTEPAGQFRVVYEMDSCNLVLYGFLDRYASVGDGYNTPDEELTKATLYAYEALDEDGNDVETDFDPTRIS